MTVNFLAKITNDPELVLMSSKYNCYALEHGERKGVCLN